MRPSVKSSVKVKDGRRNPSKERSSFESEDDDMTSKRVFVGRLPDDCFPRDPEIRFTNGVTRFGGF